MSDGTVGTVAALESAWRDVFMKLRPMIDLVGRLLKLTDLDAHPVEVDEVAAALGRSVDQTERLIGELAWPWARAESDNGVARMELVGGRCVCGSAARRPDTCSVRPSYAWTPATSRCTQAPSAGAARRTSPFAQRLQLPLPTLCFLARAVYDLRMLPPLSVLAASNIYEHAMPIWGQAFRFPSGGLPVTDLRTDGRRHDPFIERSPGKRSPQSRSARSGSLLLSFAVQRVVRVEYDLPRHPRVDGGVHFVGSGRNF